MLLAHIVDNKLCKIHLVSWTNKENNTFDTTPFVKLIRNKYTHTIHDLNNPPYIRGPGWGSGIHYSLKI